MSQCPHCFVGQCKTHLLQDGGKREKSLASRVDKKSTLEKMCTTYFGSQIKRLQADALLENVDQTKYLKESEQDRKDASKKKNKMDKSVQELALNCSLNASVLSIMARNRDDEIEHKKKHKKSKKKDRKEKKNKKSRKERKRRSRSRSRSQSRDRKKRKRNVSSSSNRDSENNSNEKISQISNADQNIQNISNINPSVLELPNQYNKDTITTTSNDDHTSPSRSSSPPCYVSTHKICPKQNDSDNLF